MKQFVITTGFLFLIAGCTSETENAKIETPVLLQETRLAVEQAISSIDQMRSGLAGTLDGSTEEVDAGTFARVCKPVGMQAKKVGEENGWLIQQVAVKNRNPANAADDQAAELSTRFMSEVDLDSLWIHTSMNEASGWRYLRRITVEPACLACHGAKESRPDFVKEKYPDDRAFDFSVGDLRGLYSVFVPDNSNDTPGP